MPQVRDPFVTLVCCLVLGTALAGCAREDRHKAAMARSPVAEAYTLLDNRQTGKAIDLLERILNKDPRQDEARLLLASAYVGKAGIDIFSLHDSFSDVLFSRSLSDVFFSGPAKLNADKALTGVDLPDTAKAKDGTAIEGLFHDIDEFLNNMRRVLVIFNRFPKVHQIHWPFLDQAIWHLDQLPQERQVRVYRMFIRLVYLKEILVTRVVRDPSLGTRAWSCRLEVQDFRDGLAEVMKALNRISDDFVRIYPREASPFVNVSALLKALDESLDHVENESPAGTETSAMVVQRRLREALRCVGLQQ